MPVRRIDLRLLSSLEALLETQNVTRAAERLGVSQPAMSRTLARLRDQLDDPLLVRGRSGMVLTPRAEALLGPLREWLNSGERILHHGEVSVARRSVRVAASDYGVICVIAPVLKAHPELAAQMVVEVMPLSAQTRTRLRDAQIDFVLSAVRYQEADLHNPHLFDDQPCVVCSPDHPLAQTGAGRLDPVRLQDHVRVAVTIEEGLLDPWLNPARGALQRDAIMTVPSFATLFFTLSQLGAYAVVPQRLADKMQAEGGLVKCELIRPRPIPFGMAWHERIDDDPVLMKWAEAVRGFCRKTK